MQRKFLEDLGLEKDVIDKIMTENGSDIEKTKQKLEADRDNYKEKLETAQEALKKFDGADIDALKTTIEKLNGDLEAKDKEYAEKLADMEFNAILGEAMSKSGAKNAKAVRALLDIDTLRSSKNQAADIETALQEAKTANDYMFVSNEPIKNPVKDTGGGSALQGNEDAMRAVMGLPPKNNYL